MVNVCLGREEKGTVYLSIHVSRVYFRRMVDKQTKSKFDRTTLFFSCDSMPGTIINQQIHTYLHVPVLLLSQVPIVSSMIPYHPITTLLGSRSHQYISALAKMCLASRSVVSAIIDRVRPRQLEIGLASSPGYIAALIMVLLQACTYQ